MVFIPHQLQPLQDLALASASPRRRDLLMSVGLRVSVIASAYEESALAGHSPRELAIAHARGKAAGAAPAAMLTVAADTVVDLDGTALGKPRDRAESRSMLAALSGREHCVHTAFALRDEHSGRIVSECVTTRVRFFGLSAEVIDAYVASGDGLDKAGAYGIQGFAATLVERIDGDYFTVVGFPLAAFARTLPLFGYQLCPPATAERNGEARLTEVPA
jgi:septum formation protein